jgi:hypothetical protein
MVLSFLTDASTFIVAYFLRVGIYLKDVSIYVFC